MDVTSILEPLNASQRKAVAAPAGHLLVLAGAGSGKTRVLCARIAWYIQTGLASPYSILAVTFTNKAAAEMRSRIEVLLDASVSGMWVGTFHGLAHRILRLHWQEAVLSQDFTILDSEDQYRAIRRVLRAMEIDESQYPPREVQWFINARKDEGLRARHVHDNNDHRQYQMIRIYQAYEDMCTRSGVVDFAELLLRVHELLRDQTNVLEQYQRRFPFVLVDEFQDTNALQYAWLRLLAGNNGCVFAVGDDDQSIYSWRGARVENMQRFRQDFAAAKLIKLEQNYRSSANILQAANALIANNQGRLGKQLWTNDEGGEKIALFNGYNEHDEAHYVVEQIVAWQNQYGSYRDIAVLYRTSAQSRVLEENLMLQRVPYRVYGGMRFYERAEIKDALAYTRLAIFHDDDVAFERIVNTPSRGIGQRTLEVLRNLARKENCSLWQAAHHVPDSQLLTTRALNALADFVRLIGEMSDVSRALSPDELINHIINISGLLEHFRKEKGERGLARIENLEELVTAAREFKADDLAGELPGDEPMVLEPLQAFLAHAALESGETQAGAHTDCVNLMTLHAAKGLEFPKVFMVGMEEGLFPHQRSIDDPTRLEEERRLCYVGMTRAKQALTLTYAQHHYWHGSDLYPLPSRFISELPETLINEVRLSGNTKLANRFGSHMPRASSETLGHYVLGQRVQHVKFGEGVVLNMERAGGNTRLQINFERVGCKWLVAEYADLQLI